jgi:hypothetical protein
MMERLFYPILYCSFFFKTNFRILALLFFWIIIAVTISLFIGWISFILFAGAILPLILLLISKKYRKYINDLSTKKVLRDL